VISVCVNLYRCAEAVSLESGEAWTYRQLVTRARRIAKKLTALVAPGSTTTCGSGLKGHIVGVYLGRGPELLASLLAVQMTRAVGGCTRCIQLTHSFA
jgi:acyl-CoA synthetase (AMP-forming)/AMP-acid ligase II